MPPKVFSGLLLAAKINAPLLLAGGVLGESDVKYFKLFAANNLHLDF